VELKWSNWAVNHSLPYSAEVMIGWSYTSHSSYTLMHAWGELYKVEDISIVFQCMGFIVP